MPSANPLRLGLLFGLVSVHMTWLRLVNRHVPKPYLDEVFHIPQAQAYWAGRWSHWDDKITTPPGLYLWSYAFNWVRLRARYPAVLSVEHLRFSNVVLVHILMITLHAWGDAARKPVDETAILHRELAVLFFPLIFFFSPLYYTDLFSACTVAATFVVACEGGQGHRGVKRFIYQVLHVLLGLLSLSSRQTNIFWVAVFLAGLQVTQSAKVGTTNNNLHDPKVNEANVEDIFHFISQLIPAVLTRLPTILIDIWPQITLLASFGAFVLWNGGVVLGDKSNHIATIHTPQLLYIWPCFVFFSWPVLLPQLLSLQRLRNCFPRPWLAILIMLGMAAAVHYNTIVHPFTLADNRHYVFYVFRILMRKWWIKYAAVPIYFTCACLVFGALGGDQLNRTGEDTTLRLSFALVWFLSTALSLVTAPLVEPRYFIVPWLVWRMYIPGIHSAVKEESSGEDIEMIESSKEGVKKDAKAGVDQAEGLMSHVVNLLIQYSVWIELAWYFVINCVTCWMFLARGFAWKQEPGRVQRFMW